MHREKLFVFVLIRNHKDKIDDFVSRELVRSYYKLEIVNNPLIVEEGVLLPVYIKNNRFYDLLSNHELNWSNVDIYSVLNFDIYRVFSLEELTKLTLLIRKILFLEPVKIDFMEISTMEEKAKDRFLQFQEYLRDLAENPYSNDKMYTKK